MLRPGLLLLVMTWALSGCMSLEVPDHYQSSQRIDGLPFFPQDQYQCGPAALATVLAHQGLTVEPTDLVPLIYVPERQGSFQVEVVAAARHHGMLAYQDQLSFEDLLAEVSAGHPVLVMQNLGLSWLPQWHFAVVKGFDPTSRRMILNSGLYEDYAQPMTTFMRTWQRAEHWALLVLPPGEMPITAKVGTYLNALLALERQQPPALQSAYQAGLQRWPEDRNLLMAHGNFHYGRGNRQEALQAYRSAAQQDPDYAPAHNNMAQVMLELGDIQGARQHAQMAVQLGGAYQAEFQATLDTIEAVIELAAEQSD